MSAGLQSNNEGWISAWAEQGRELVHLLAYLSLLDETRHHKFKAMPVWKIFGAFTCPGCWRSWTSTECVVSFVYRYHPELARGEVRMIREFGQECRRCFKLARPTFDTESAAKTLGKLIQRIKKVFYGIEDQQHQRPESDIHSSARLRNFPHNSARCEACRCGVCFFDVNRATPSGQKLKLDRLEGPRARIAWVFGVYHKRRLLCEKLIRPEALLEQPTHHAEPISYSDPTEQEKGLKPNADNVNQSHEREYVRNCPASFEEIVDGTKPSEELNSVPLEPINSSSTDAEKLLASALAKLGIEVSRDSLNESRDSNTNVDLSYYNYYY